MNSKKLYLFFSIFWHGFQCSFLQKSIIALIIESSFMLINIWNTWLVSIRFLSSFITFLINCNIFITNKSWYKTVETQIQLLLHVITYWGILAHWKTLLLINRTNFYNKYFVFFITLYNFWIKMVILSWKFSNNQLTLIGLSKKFTSSSIYDTP